MKQIIFIVFSALISSSVHSDSAIEQYHPPSASSLSTTMLSQLCSHYMLKAPKIIDWSIKEAYGKAISKDIIECNVLGTEREITKSGERYSEVEVHGYIIPKLHLVNLAID